MKNDNRFSFLLKIVGEKICTVDMDAFHVHFQSLISPSLLLDTNRRIGDSIVFKSNTASYTSRQNSQILSTTMLHNVYTNMKKLLYDLPLHAYLPTYLKCGGCHMDASAFLQRQMRL